MCTLLQNSTKTYSKIISRLVQKPILYTAWTSEPQEIILDIKKSITSSPVLSRHELDKTTFLKTDWSADGMACILMQPSKDDEYTKAVIHLEKTSECLFDMDLNGVRLKTISYGSRACTNMERKYHSFVGEAASG